MAGGGAGRSLQETAMWAIATICIVFIFLGVSVERLIHFASHWPKKRKNAALREAIEKLKSVLMELGFMSLFLTVTQEPLSKICVSHRAAEFMVTCGTQFKKDAHSKSSDYCGSKGKISLISIEGMHEIHIYIFVVAAMQIIFSLTTMAFGRAKMKRWKSWEKETQTPHYVYMIASDPERLTSSFGTNSAHLWIKCFFRQFFQPVAKVDYLTLRQRFISAHISTNNSFNFQKYIQQSVEDDYKAIVGIHPIMWMMVVTFFFVYYLTVPGMTVVMWLWIAFLPLLILLFVGTKLETILAKMSIQLANNNTLVQPDLNLFWFKRPQLMLTLLHFILFVNTFEISFFIWVTWQFGTESCYDKHDLTYLIKIVIGAAVQVLCSYNTLPLYALVTRVLQSPGTDSEPTTSQRSADRVKPSTSFGPRPSSAGLVITPSSSSSMPTAPPLNPPALLLRDALQLLIQQFPPPTP